MKDMENTPPQNDDDSAAQQLSEEQEQQVEAMVGQVVAAIESGQSPDNVFAALAGLPAHLQEDIRRKVAAMLEQHQAQRQQQEAAQEQKEATQEKQKQGTLRSFTMSVAARLIGQKALGKITALMNARPDISQAVQAAGESLQRHGVQPDAQAIPEADLGRAVPSVGKGQQQNQQRGV